MYVQDTERLHHPFLQIIPNPQHADGDYSDIEKACIGELVRIVREKWGIGIVIRAAHL